MNVFGDHWSASEGHCLQAAQLSQTQRRHSLIPSAGNTGGGSVLTQHSNLATPSMRQIHESVFLNQSLKIVCV